MSKRTKHESKPEPKPGEAITEELTAKDVEERAAEEARDFPEEPKPQGLFSKSEVKDKIVEEIEQVATVEASAELVNQKGSLFSVEAIAAEHAKIAKANGFSAEASELKAVSQILAKLQKGKNYLVKEAKSI